MSARPLEFPPVPTIGERVKLLQHYHTFVVQCQCEAKTVLVIIGNGQGVACPACGTVPVGEMKGQARVGHGVTLDALSS